MKYRCIKLTEDAWAKAFEVGREYECRDIILNNDLKARELEVLVGTTSYIVPYDCFALVEQETPTEELNPLEVQEGGNHYKDMVIQPIQFIMANELDYIQGNVIKYVCRYKDKNGVEDLKKARHYLDIKIAEYEGK